MSVCRQCGFDNSVTGCVFEEGECPAEGAIRLCNALQIFFMGAKYEDIRDKFQWKLQEELERVGYECFVFWTPESEKVTDDSNLLSKIVGSEWYNRTNFHKCLNGIIWDLNNKLYSHDFLRELVALTDSAKSRVFRLLMDDESICFLALYPETNKGRGNTQPRIHDLRVQIRFPTQESPAMFLERLKGTGIDKQHLSETVTDYIDKWEAPDISSVVEATRSSTEMSLDPEYTKTLQVLWIHSVRHIALMFLFSELNSFKSVTYYLSPLDRDRLKSSMVIYWKNREPGRSYHYLLQMLLGLNAAPILFDQEESKARESSIVHLGHSLNHRVASLVPFFNAYVLQDNDPLGYVAKHTTAFLDNYTVLLQAANIHSFSSLLKYEKRSRFLTEIQPDQPNYPLIDIIERCRMMASKPHWQKYRGVEDEYWVELQIIYTDPSVFELAPLSVDPTLRVNPLLLTPILTELFDNISSHGEIDHEERGVHGYKKRLLKRLGVFSESIGDQTALVISSPVFNPDCQIRLLKGEKVGQKYSTGYLVLTQQWEPWPRNIIHSGPGLSIDTLRQIELVDLFYRMRPFRDGFKFDTALVVKGLFVRTI